MPKIILEIPDNKFSLFSEVFLTAIQESKTNNNRKMRFVNLYTDLFDQKKNNDNVIYTTYTRNQIVELFKDLRDFYKKYEQTGPLSRVQSIINQITEY